jgi:hypothetical protein
MAFLDIACEDIWMSNNKLEAQYFIRLFEEELTNYHWLLLEEVVFGRGEANAA